MHGPETTLFQAVQDKYRKSTQISLKELENRKDVLATLHKMHSNLKLREIIEKIDYSLKNLESSLQDQWLWKDRIFNLINQGQLQEANKEVALFREGHDEIELDDFLNELFIHLQQFGEVHAAIIQKESLLHMALPSILILLFNIVLVSIIIRSIKTPVMDLINKTRLIAGGDLTQRVTINAKDDIGLLGESFNQMTEDLSRARDKMHSLMSYTDSIIYSMTDILIVLDPEGKIKTANKAALDYSGYDEQELIGRPLADIITGDALLDMSRLKELIRKGPIQMDTISYHTKSGGNIPVSLSGSAIKDDADNLLGIVCIARDMSEINMLVKTAQSLAEIAESAADSDRIRAEELDRSQLASLNIMLDLDRQQKELKEAYKDLNTSKSELSKTYDELAKTNEELKNTTVQVIQNEKMSALGELTAGVAHELNQPLNGMKLICQDVLRDISKGRFDESTLEEDLKEVVSEVDRMSNIIDHMRLFSRTTMGAEFQVTEVNEAVEGVFKLLGQQLHVHNIHVEKSLGSELPSVPIDRIRLEQVFMNIINNARNAVESTGNKEMNIWVSSYFSESNGNRTVIVSVKDNGGGIPEEIRNRIFEPFYTTKRPGKGTGLGLSVSKKIIDDANGTIELMVEDGIGSQFNVILPAVPLTEEQMPDNESGESGNII